MFTSYVMPAAQLVVSGHTDHHGYYFVGYKVSMCVGAYGFLACLLSNCVCMHACVCVCRKLNDANPHNMYPILHTTL